MVTAAILLTTLSACASSQAQSPQEAVTGCYQFEWDRHASALGLPWGFQLLPDSLEGWGNIPDGRLAWTLVSPRERRDTPFRFWMRMETDSIRVGHPGGGGFSLTLAPNGTDLVGSARPVGDLVIPGEPPGVRDPRPVTARRVICGASPG